MMTLKKSPAITSRDIRFSSANEINKIKTNDFKDVSAVSGWYKCIQILECFI